MSNDLDLTDRRILDLLQRDANLPVAHLAEQVGLSPSPCWRRVKRLESAGVIQARVVLLDRATLGLTLEAFCAVKLSLPTKENLSRFEAAIGQWPEVIQCATVTGAADYELRIVTRDMSAFDDFIRVQLLSLQLISNLESRIVMRSVKDTTVLSLDGVAAE